MQLGRSYVDSVDSFDSLILKELVQKTQRPKQYPWASNQRMAYIRKRMAEFNVENPAVDQTRHPKDTVQAHAFAFAQHFGT